MNGTLEQVFVSCIHDLPVQTKNTSVKLVQIMTATAKSEPDKIRPILVGKINDLLYPINDFEAVQGLRKAGIKRCSAYVEDYATMQDLLVAHVRMNFLPQAIDPLRIRQVVGYMVKRGMSVPDACKLLWVDKRAELHAAIHAVITDKAQEVLLDLVQEISQKIYSVVIPAYYVTKLARIKKDEQYDAALEIKSFTIPNMISNEKSSWPSLDTIDHILAKFHNTPKSVPVSARVAAYGDVEDLAKKKKADKPDAKTTKKAAKFIAEDPNLIYVPTSGNQPDLLLNKKTGRVAVAKEVDGVYSMTDDLGKSKLVLSEHITEYLGVDGNDSLVITKYPTIQKAIDLLGKAKDMQGKCVVLSTVSLPKR